MPLGSHNFLLVALEHSFTLLLAIDQVLFRQVPNTHGIILRSRREYIVIEWRDLQVEKLTAVTFQELSLIKLYSAEAFNGAHMDGVALGTTADLPRHLLHGSKKGEAK